MSEHAKRGPWRCRWFGHDWRDPHDGREIHYFIPSVMAHPGPDMICARCGAEKKVV